MIPIFRVSRVVYVYEEVFPADVFFNAINTPDTERICSLVRVRIILRMYYKDTW